MDELIATLIEVSDMMYAGMGSEARKILLDQAEALGTIPGIHEVIDPLFDALEREDYLFAADIIRYDICVKPT